MGEQFASPLILPILSCINTELSVLWEDEKGKQGVNIDWI